MDNFGFCGKLLGRSWWEIYSSTKLPCGMQATGSVFQQTFQDGFWIGDRKTKASTLNLGTSKEKILNL